MTQPDRPTLIALFASRRAAEQALAELRAADFSEKDLGFAIRGSAAFRELDEHDGQQMPTDSSHTRDGQGAVGGMIAGGLTGSAIGALAAVLIPGAGPILAAGVLTSMLGFGAAGVATGGIVGALMGLGVTEEEAREHESHFQAGRAIVTVRCGSRLSEARSIAARNGAINLNRENDTSSAGAAEPT